MGYTTGYNMARKFLDSSGARGRPKPVITRETKVKEKIKFKFNKTHITLSIPSYKLIHIKLGDARRLANWILALDK